MTENWRKRLNQKLMKLVIHLECVEMVWKDKEENVTSSRISFYVIWNFESYYCVTYFKMIKSITKREIK